MRFKDKGLLLIASIAVALCLSANVSNVRKVPGNLVVQSRDGSSITLPANDTGTFTPTIVATGMSAITYTVQVGKYSKIGNVVHFTLYVAFTTYTGSASGNLTVGGLPYPNANVTNQYVGGHVELGNITLNGSTRYAGMELQPNSSTILITENFSNASNGTLNAATAISSSATVKFFIITGFYFTN